VGAAEQAIAAAEEFLEKVKQDVKGAGKGKVIAMRSRHGW